MAFLSPPPCMPTALRCPFRSYVKKCPCPRALICKPSAFGLRSSRPSNPSPHRFLTKTRRINTTFGCRPFFSIMDGPFSRGCRKSFSTPLNLALETVRLQEPTRHHGAYRWQSFFILEKGEHTPVSLHSVATCLVYICDSHASVLFYNQSCRYFPLPCIYLKISLALPIFHSVGMVPPPPRPPPPRFHERQRMLCCGAHTLNNPYQHKWIDSAAMDKLASSLAAADKEEQSQEKGGGRALLLLLLRLVPVCIQV